MINVNLDTNFNKKLGCDSFVHIALAPKSELTLDLMAEIKKYEYLIRTKDESHPEIVCRVVDILKFDLVSLPTILTLTSHDMEAEEFIKWVIGKKPDLHFGTKMAVYFYKKKK